MNPVSTYFWVIEILNIKYKKFFYIVKKVGYL